MKSKYIALGLVILLLIGAKLWHRQSQTDDLIMLLAPTSSLVRVSTGIPFVQEDGRGFVCTQPHILIDKSCAGFNYWLICFCTLFFGFVGKYKGLSKQIVYGMVVLCLSYLFTIIANTSRIIVSIQALKFKDLGVNTHEIIGIVVYFSFLILTYNAFNHLVFKNHQ